MSVLKLKFVFNNIKGVRVSESEVEFELEFSGGKLCSAFQILPVKDGKMLVPQHMIVKEDGMIEVQR